MKKYAIIIAVLLLPAIGLCQQESVQQQNIGFAYHPQYKNPAAAFVLSGFIPGLGQMYNDEVGNGFCFFVAFYGCAIASATCYFVGNHHPYDKNRYAGSIFFGASAVITWLWSVIDAPISANKLNMSHGFVVSASPTLLMDNNLVLSNTNVVAPGLSLNISF